MNMQTLRCKTVRSGKERKKERKKKCSFAYLQSLFEKIKKFVHEYASIAYNNPSQNTIRISLFSNWVIK